MTLQSIMLYVPDVRASVAFYERAFGLKTAFVTEEGDYAQMETGGAALAFAAESAAPGLGLDLRLHCPGEPAAALQLALVLAEGEDPAAAFARVGEAGGTVVNPPTARPWGQTVGHVRDPDGVLIEIGTPQPADWHEENPSA